MAFNGLRYSVQVMRKLAIRTIRTSTRPIFNHPFLVGGFLFVIFLYRSSPFLFSILLSVSPVLVCTAVLLGTLLTFGHPQIPEIEKDENVITNEKMSSLRANPLQNRTAVVQEEAILLTRDYPNTEIGRQTSVDKVNEGVSFLGDVFPVSESKQGGLSTWNSREIAFEARCVKAASDEYKSREVVITDVSHEEMPAFEAIPNSYEVLEKTAENGGSPGGSVDGHMDDHFESSSMPWARVNGDEDEDELSDCESSSPEASLDDIIPLLDEIHPLFECENSINSSLLGNRSHSSYESSISSDEETDHKEAEEEEEEEEENQANQEDAEKSAITWTEDDQKNVMDLGSSELERNRRLESLIARRIARRSMKTTNERNLIDLDGFDLPFQVPTISTTRQNPFDFPNDTYDDTGLPPIPGSAPSILLPRRNPFDLPYDSSEEKPDLTGDNFHQEFVEPNQKEAVFRRHESFNIGSSFFEGRDANRASRLRPYFVPERLAPELGTGYSSFMRQSNEVSELPFFQRQTSEFSSTSSFYRQASGLSEASSSYQRQSSDMSESKSSSVAEIEPVPAEERVSDSEIDHASVQVERGSPSSDIVDDQHENRDFDLHMPEIRLGGSENDVEVSELIVKQDEEKHDSSSSSSSSSSEEIDDVQDVDEGLVEGEEIGYNLIEKYDDQADKLTEASEFHHHYNRHTHSPERSTLEANLMLETLEEEHISTSSSSLVSEELNNTESLKHEEAIVDLEDPVYDSSPRASKNHLSISSEHLLEEFSELDNKDVKQERDGLSSKDDGDIDHGVLHQEVGERVDDISSDYQLLAANEHLSSVQADLFSLATELTEEPELVNEDTLLSEEAGFNPDNLVNLTGNVEETLNSVADEAYIYQDNRDYQEESFVIPEKLEEVNKTELQVVEPESSEIIKKPCVENAGKSAPDVSSTNKSVEIAEAGIEENKEGIHIVDAEAIKSIKQSNDENAKNSTPVVNTIDPEVENAEPECSENFEENPNGLIKEEIVVESTKDDPIVQTPESVDN